MTASPRASLVAVLRANPGFRRLWLAEFISFFGDWFTLVALVQLVEAATGSGIAVGALLATQMLPNLLLSAVAGSVADRVPRRTVMLACDGLRAVGALGFLLPVAVDLPASVAFTWVLGLVAAQHALTTFFRPASSASVPGLVPPEHLAAAGTLNGLSWSLGLVIGSALGGLAVTALGLGACFVLDAATFLVSAAILWGAPLARTRAATGPRRRGAGPLGMGGDFGELLVEMRARPMLRAAVLTKCAWGVGAAQLLLLTRFGHEILGVGAAAAGFGLLYSARGMGTAVGPMLARRILGESDAAIRASIVAGFAVAALFYAGFGLQPPMLLALGCVAAAHAGGSAIWIGATVLVQRNAPDAVRGRAFALEMALHTLTASAAPLAAGALLDLGFAPATLVLLFAGVTVVTGGLWSWLAYRPSHRGPA